MIPKIIHYVWLGGNQLPLAMQRCIDSWRKFMPDYEIIKWDDERIAEIDSIFMREAIAEKKWAFVSDVVRLYAIANYGGIYLDTDVEVFKSFDPLLLYHAFIGRENSMHLKVRRTINYVTTCTFGAEPNNRFIKTCLAYYNGRHFSQSHNADLPTELRLDIKLNSEIFTVLLEKIGYNPSVLKNEFQDCGDMVVFPSDYFDPNVVQPCSYSKHLALGTWRDSVVHHENYSLKYKIQWRLWRVVELILKRFNRVIIKLR